MDEDTIQMQEHVTTHFLPKNYATVNQMKLIDQIQYENLDIRFGNSSDYEFRDFLGGGASGKAYLGIQKSTGMRVVIKSFKSLKMYSIQREIKIMTDVQGHPNISPLLDVIQKDKKISLIFQRFAVAPTSLLFKRTNDVGNKFFLYQTLYALDYVHSKGIIHADMKPANIITNPKTKMLKIIDWGLSQYYLPGEHKSPKVGTKSYKAPEILMGYPFYDYEIDIFSVGFMFAKMIFKNKSPFDGRLPRDSNNTIYLQRIAKVFGSEKLYSYAKKLNRKLEIQQIEPLNEWPESEFATPDAIDLLTKMMEIDHTQRITAREALKHPYFDSIKK